MEAVALPTISSELVRVDAGNEGIVLFAPRDFEAAVRKGRLRSMLMEHRKNLINGTMVRQGAREETVQVMEAIQRYLDETGELPTS